MQCILLPNCALPHLGKHTKGLNLTIGGPADQPGGTMPPCVGFNVPPSWHLVHTWRAALKPPSPSQSVHPEFLSFTSCKIKIANIAQQLLHVPKWVWAFRKSEPFQTTIVWGNFSSLKDHNLLNLSHWPPFQVGCWQGSSESLLGAAGLCQPWFPGNWEKDAWYHCDNKRTTKKV